MQNHYLAATPQRQHLPSEAGATTAFAIATATVVVDMTPTAILSL